MIYNQDNKEDLKKGQFNWAAWQQQNISNQDPRIF
jgi:hypothetical protein